MSEARRKATYADLLKVPDHLVAEIVGGELHASPRPAARHSAASYSMGVDLGGPFTRGRGGPGGWWILFEPELHLGEDVLVPDLAGWRKERMPTIPDVAAFEMPPDWICEVLSPKTGRLDRIQKLPAYAEHGVVNAWLVDPILKTLEVFRLHEGHWLLVGQYGGDQRVRAEPFDAVELDLAGWWLPDAD